ncbi:MAG: hypothetical protein H0V66_11005 [Bdellovibrionales bacterium]|nr:hypothetical protein [Bdellovibrionales bacterium]
MKLNFEYSHHELIPDLTTEPAWAGKIKRFSQLDQESFVVAEVTHRCLNFLGKPDQFIILSSHGSSQTDFLFAHSNKISPSYFVHTLPNVRSLAFSSLTAWEGPVFCFSQGKHSLVRCLNEIALVHHGVKTLILNLNKVDGIYYCDFYKIGKAQGNGLVLERSETKSSDEYLLDDFTFRKELELKSLVQIKDDLIIRK